MRSSTCRRSTSCGWYLMELGFYGERPKFHDMCVGRRDQARSEANASRSISVRDVRAVKTIRCCIWWWCPALSSKSGCCNVYWKHPGCHGNHPRHQDTRTRNWRPACLIEQSSDERERERKKKKSRLTSLVNLKARHSRHQESRHGPMREKERREALMPQRLPQHQNKGRDKSCLSSDRLQGNRLRRSCEVCGYWGLPHLPAWKLKACLDVLCDDPPDPMAFARLTAYQFFTSKLAHFATATIATLSGCLLEVQSHTARSSSATAAALSTET